MVPEKYALIFLINHIIIIKALIVIGKCSLNFKLKKLSKKIFKNLLVSFLVSHVFKAKLANPKFCLFSKFIRIRAEVPSVNFVSSNLKIAFGQ